MMNTEIVNAANVVKFPRPCTLCDARENVQLFAGLMVCEQCQENIKITNFGLFEANYRIEQKAQD